MPDAGGSSQPRVAAITMVKNEGYLLPRWLRYYGEAFGAEHLVVIDDSSTDGSTNDLPGSVLRLPDYHVGAEQRGTRSGFANVRAQFVSRVADALHRYYDVVVYTDVDEFLVPDPDRYADLRAYVAAMTEPVVAGVGLNLVHVRSLEPEFDDGGTILGQRRHVKFTPKMCKPLITRRPVSWTSGFHGCSAEYRIDPDLLLIHAKFFDFDFVLRNQRARNELFRSGRGGPASTWGIPVEELETTFADWASAPSQQQVLDTRALDLDIVRLLPKGHAYESSGVNQTRSMAEGDLVLLPDRVQADF